LPFVVKSGRKAAGRAGCRRGLHGREPVLTRDEEPSAAALRTAQAKALGAQTFQLVSVVSFKPETHLGQKMEARGLLYKDDKDARLNLTSLSTINSSCP